MRHDIHSTGTLFGNINQLQFNHHLNYIISASVSFALALDLSTSISSFVYWTNLNRIHNMA